MYGVTRVRSIPKGLNHSAQQRGATLGNNPIKPSTLKALYQICPLAVAYSTPHPLETL